MRTVEVTRYVTPLREGGSLPGLVEADDDGIYVLKFRAAGQGPAALVAEIVVAGLARELGIRVPELVLAGLDVEIGRREPDPEVQSLLVASAGLNLGIDFLPGSIGYGSMGSSTTARGATAPGSAGHRGKGFTVPAEEAAAILWLDAFTANIDRTWRNPNLLIWHRELWAIDHGAALVFQHAWPPVERWAARAYDLSGHVLRPAVQSLSGARSDGAGLAGARLDELDARFAELVSDAVIAAALAEVPDAWLAAVLEPPPLVAPGAPAPPGPDAGALAETAARGRQRYADYLVARRAAPRTWCDWAQVSAA